MANGNAAEEWLRMSQFVVKELERLATCVEQTNDKIDKWNEKLAQIGLKVKEHNDKIQAIEQVGKTKTRWMIAVVTCLAIVASAAITGIVTYLLCK